MAAPPGAATARAVCPETSQLPLRLEAPAAAVTRRTTRPNACDCRNTSLDVVELDERSPGRNGVGRDANSDCQGAKTSRSFRSFRSDLNDLTDLADFDLSNVRNLWSIENINTFHFSTKLNKSWTTITP